MKSGRCPKCRSTDVRVGPPGTTLLNDMNMFSISFWSNTTAERYVCTACGYMEQYVADPADRRKIAAKWPGVSS
jgi:predicted nucleic-acid-binding Zn-ribbon protein